MAGVREPLPLLFCDLRSSTPAILVQDTYCEVPSLLSCPHTKVAVVTCGREKLRSPSEVSLA